MRTDRYHGLALPLAILVAVAAVGLVTTNRLVAAVASEDRSYQTIINLDDIDSGLDDLEAARRAYAATGDVAQLVGYDALVAHLEELEAALAARVATELAQARRVARLHPLVATRIAGLAAAIAERGDLGFDASRETQRIAESIAANTAIHAVLDPMLAHERESLESHQRATTAEVSYERVVQVLGTAVGIFLLVVAFAKLRQEIRRRRASERDLAVLLESIGDGVIAADRDARITRMNPVAERLTGWSAIDAIGRPFSEVFQIIDETTGEPAADPVHRVLTEHAVVGLPDQAALVTRTGGRTPVADSAAPIRNADGSTTGAVIVFRDAGPEREWADALGRLNTELEVRVEERTAALKRSEDQLRQAIKMEGIGRLAGGIAHDFNNLLSVILSYTEFARDDASTTGTLRGDLDEIHDAARRAADLTRQLLAFSRQQVLAPRVLDLDDVIHGMDKLLRRVIGEHIELRTVRNPAIARVVVDPGQMEQVIMNLVVNARDAMPRGGTLSVATSTALLVEPLGTLAPGRYVMLELADTGTGMDAETRARIFEPFFTTKPPGSGTGLGLATVFGIVQQSGGGIVVESELGAGTAFRIYLPLSGERPDALAADEAPAVAGAETILLVEDEDHVRSAARRALTSAGYKVLEACNGEEALALSRRFPQPIHLLLTDVVMPKMSGRELVERLALIHPEKQVLFMSGYTDDMIVHHGVDQGIAFLQKPITPAALRSKVREVLDAR